MSKIRCYQVWLGENRIYAVDMTMAMLPQSQEYTDSSGKVHKQPYHHWKREEEEKQKWRDDCHQFAFGDDDDYTVYYMEAIGSATRKHCQIMAGDIHNKLTSKYYLD